MNLGAKLKALRERENMLQKEVSDHLKIDRSTYGKYETNDSSPDYDKLLKLADLFGVSVDYLLGRGNPCPNYDTRIQSLTDDKKRILDTVLQELERSNREQTAMGE